MKYLKKVMTLFTVLLMSLAFMGISSVNAVNFTAGTYSGEAEGHNGVIEVEVTVTEDSIESIKVISHSETAGLSDPAIEQIPANIIEEQSLDVNVVSGATKTSEGLLLAIANAINQTGVNSEDLAKKEKEEVELETEELNTQLLVIGGGPSGMAAALRAEEQGLEVILLEKQAMMGGSLALSSGIQVVSGSNIQTEMGVTDDSVESMIADFMKNGHDLNVEELVTVYAENVGPTTDWLIDYVGIQYDTSAFREFAEYEKPRVLYYDGGGFGFTKSITDKVAETNIQTMLNTRATRLMYEDGKITGAYAEGQDNAYEIHADVVLLATGGYANNEALLSEELQTVLYYGPSTATGDGIEMATEEGINADTRLMELGKIYPNGLEIEEGIAKSTFDASNTVLSESGIIVDVEGKRIVNEKASQNELKNVLMEQDAGVMYLLLDQKTFNLFVEKMANVGVNEDQINEWLEFNGSAAPQFMKGETLVELAEVAGMDPSILEATVNDYNTFVENGEDTEFSRPVENLQTPIGEGTYYLIEQKPRFATTLGGLVVNSNLQVLDKDGEIVTGLYAAGETIGGVMGDDSAPGANNGWALTSGKTVAEAILDFLENN